MANMAQHQAAELWELSRDHCVVAAKLHLFSRQIQDHQLRSSVERHARRFQEIGQQLEGFLRQTGATHSVATGFHQYQSFQPSTGQSSFGQSTFGQQPAEQGTSFQGYQQAAGAQAFDILVAAECLKDCKSFAVKSMLGATESAQPVRGLLYQIAGEHLQAAEEHYHWLERRGYYASPKIDMQALNEYSQALRQVAQSGQQASFQTIGQPQAYGAFQSTTQPFSSHYPQTQNLQQPAYSTTSNFNQPPR